VAPILLFSNATLAFDSTLYTKDSLIVKHSLDSSIISKMNNIEINTSKLNLQLENFQILTIVIIVLLVICLILLFLIFRKLRKVREITNIEGNTEITTIFRATNDILTNISTNILTLKADIISNHKEISLLVQNILTVDNKSTGETNHEISPPSSRAEAQIVEEIKLKYLKIDTSTLTKEISYSDKETPFIEIERDEKNKTSTVAIKAGTVISVSNQKEPYEVIFEVIGDQGLVEMQKSALIQWKNTIAHKKENGRITLKLP